LKNRSFFLCGCFIALTSAVVPRCAHANELATQDGLYMRFRGLTGELLSLVNRTEPVPLHVITESYPTFSIADHTESKRSGRISINVSESADGGLAINGRSDECMVDLSCEVQALPNYMRFSLRLLDRSGEDRAVTLRLQVPVEAEGWLWWDDVATSRRINLGKRYIRYGHKDKGIFPAFWCPLGAISGGTGHGLAFAVPMDPPTLARVGYDGDFFIEFDVGLSEATAKFPGRADLTFYLYNFDSDWGLRAALKKYYDLFPQFFVKRVTKEGLWLARMPTQFVDRPEDFGITFHQVSSVKTNSLHVDNAAGFYTFMYNEPGRVGISLPFEEEAADQPPEAEDFLPEVFAQRGYEKPSAEYVLRKVQEFADDPTSSQHASALATLKLASKKPDGTFYINVVPRPGVGWRCLFSAATDPEIVLPERNETILDRWRRTQLDRMLSLYDGRYDGQYIDSSEWMADTVNCRRDHFAYADYPLGFDRRSATAGINTGVARFEYLKAISDEVHRAGKLMMANGTPMRYGFFVSVLDIAGSEVWHSRWSTPPGFGQKHRVEGREWVPPMDWRSEQAMYCRRSLLYQKPFCFLLKLMSPEETRAFGIPRLRILLDWCLFFAVYPSISEGIYEDPEPYRDLYRKYVPVVRALGTAGWEPVTHARTDNADIRVERYGYWSQGTLHFACRNFTDADASGKLTIDAEALKIGEGAVLRDAFTREKVDWQRSGGKITVPIALAATETAVIKVGFDWDEGGAGAAE